MRLFYSLLRLCFFAGIFIGPFTVDLHFFVFKDLIQ